MDDTRAELLPVEMPGHWDTPEGHEMASRYLGQSRSELCNGDMSDLALANRMYMAGRNYLDLIGWQTAAKERIRWLSAQLAAARAAPPPAREATEAMVEVGSLVVRSADYVWDCDKLAEAVWRAMYDAALPTPTEDANAKQGDGV